MIETPRVLHSMFDISINHFIDLFICNLIYSQISFQEEIPGPIYMIDPSWIHANQLYSTPVGGGNATKDIW